MIRRERRLARYRGFGADGDYVTYTPDTTDVSTTPPDAPLPLDTPAYTPDTTNVSATPPDTSWLDLLPKPSSSDPATVAAWAKDLYTSGKASYADAQKAAAQYGVSLPADSNSASYSTTRYQPATLASLLATNRNAAQGYLLACVQSGALTVTDAQRIAQNAGITLPVTGGGTSTGVNIRTSGRSLPGVVKGSVKALNTGGQIKQAPAAAAEPLIKARAGLNEPVSANGSMILAAAVAAWFFFK